MKLASIAGRIREANAKFANAFNDWLFDVGSNLVEARTMLSQNGSHGSAFGEWVESECEISKRHTNRIIAAYQTQTLLRPIGLRKLPASESQYRELAVVPEEELPQVWERIIDSGQPITARVIRETVKEHQKEQDEEDGIIEREHQHDFEDGVAIKEIVAGEIEDDREEVAEDQDDVIEQATCTGGSRQMSTTARTLSKKDQRTQLLIDDLRSRVSLMLDQYMGWTIEHGPNLQVFADFYQNGDSAEVEELATHLTTVAKWSETVARLLRGENIPVK